MGDHRISLQRLTGACLLALGGTVMLGWLLRFAPLIRIHPEFAPMVFNTALCFALAGGALVAPTARRAALWLAGALVLLPALVLVEHLTGVALLIDAPELHRWMTESKTPGRMSAATSSGFLLSGLALLVAARVRAPWAGAAVRALAVAVAAIGLLALAGYAVRARLLFPGYVFISVAVHTAIGLTLLGGGLWAVARRALPEGSAAPLLQREDDRITFVGASVLAVVAIAAGLATFSILQDEVLSLATKNLLASQGRRSETFVDFISLREGSARVAATRPAALRNLRAIRAGRTGRDGGSDLANLKAVVDSFVKEGFSGIAYLDPEGKVIASGGHFIADPDIVAPLDTPGKGELLWEDGFLLRHRLPLRDAEGEVGTLLAEQPMQVLTRLARNVGRLGATSDMGVCFGDAARDRLRCFPQRLNPKVFDTPLVNANGQPLPMTRALGGENGTIVTLDYRGQNVVAAFGPVGDLGLGMVVKMDAAEIFEPVRDKLLPAAAIVLALIIAGTVLLRLRVKPLATRLVNLNQDLGLRSTELESANRELEAFSYSVSHDLRAPLRHMAGFTDMLREDYADRLDDGGRRYLNVISEAAARMGQLIDDLLGFSRMGRVEMHQSRFQSADLVREVLTQLEPDLKDRSIEWDIGELPEVRGDRPLLKQVWVNLLSNAVKYTRGREPAKISVSCRHEGREYLFCVQDNGAGFEMEYAAKLFGVFQRLHRQDEFEGTGVGLANVRRIVARHGGRTWAEGKKGEGAQFCFSLPDSKEASA